MEIINSLSQYTGSDALCVALGFFDGIHTGHQELIRHTVSFAKKKGLLSAVLTFDDHPANVLSNKNLVSLITDNNRKAKLIEQLGVDLLFMLPFNKAMSEISPLMFAKEILSDALRTKYAFCGVNYFFGKGAEGNRELLANCGKEYGFDVITIKPVLKDNVMVSSSSIRELIRNGDIKTANSYLGYYFSICETVVEGKKIGRTIDTPTINQNINSCFVVPRHSVYATATIVNGIIYPSVTNVGLKPTVSDDNLEGIETHIISINDDLYGQNINVLFLDRIRDEVKFKDLSALKAQIAKDIIKTEQIFKNNKKILEKVCKRGYY